MPVRWVTVPAWRRIVCVFEEFSDLLSYGRKDIETRIGRLGQKARGAGIHMILTVQQPSRDIVKGTLQATIPARIGLKVNSPIESRMLLDREGAEELLSEGTCSLRILESLCAYRRRIFRRMSAAEYLPPPAPACGTDPPPAVVVGQPFRLRSGF